MTRTKSTGTVRGAPRVPDDSSEGVPSDGARAVSMLVTGPLLYAGAGWAVDRFWLDTGVLTGVGLLIGAVLSGFMFYRRYRDPA